MHSTSSAAVAAVHTPKPMGVFTFVASAMTDVQRLMEARATRRELEKLTDRELDDIGLHRGGIEEVVEKIVR